MIENNAIQYGGWVGVGSQIQPLGEDFGLQQRRELRGGEASDTELDFQWRGRRI